MNFMVANVLIALVTALACALPGVFLVLRRLSLVAEGISHAVLPGLVAAFAVSAALDGAGMLPPALAPLLIILAPALIGVLLVFGVETLNKTGLLTSDASLGILFPALFSIGVILVSRRYSGIPLSEGSILMGDITFSALQQLQVGSLVLGPRALYRMGAILLLNALFILLFYKELKITTFDPLLATSLGIRPGKLHYAFTALVAITIVGAFETVGAILVVALLTAPAAAAYLISKTLPRMIFFSCLIAATGALGGLWIAWVLDSTTSGTMAMVMGLIFLGILTIAPRRGLVGRWLLVRRQRLRFAEQVLVAHLIHHARGERAAPACSTTGIGIHLQWSRAFANRVVARALLQGTITLDQGNLLPTEKGRTFHRSFSYQDSGRPSGRNSLP
ncbi:manganese/zinc/iron transport system permease protein [Alkalispirochaeta americana]|uniref:Manganese/zinc/iron transport system permease protein n=1 Tax=Alkalispirochaeta americana TaxID=159291 RepID=A0A1N6VZ08_9SPIO|nr:metal ABC transporter permease [Alkalispirochaeta americana]SIQ82998.1 manganese/zinc/iron transport system permease protein [Alkalispirochaeta americana]